MSDKLLFKAYHIERSKPENYKEGELDFCSKEFFYTTSDVELVDIKNCFVSDLGFVYPSYFSIHKKSLLNPAYYSNYFTVKHYLKKVLLRKKRKTHPNKQYLLVVDEWSHGHYHWFCDVLPRIYAIKETLKDYILLLPAHSSYIRTIGVESLNLLDLKPLAFEFIGGQELLHVQNLTLVTHTCIPGYSNDVLVRGLRDLLFEKSGLNKKDIPRKKIYISREKARFRKILNEGPVQEVLKSFDYEVVFLENMSLKDQIELISSAKSIVSIHGAGLTSVYFLPRGSSVLEFRRDKIYHNQCYWHLSSALQHKYFYLFGKPDIEDKVIEGQGCNITIDIKKLKTVLREMEKRN